MGYSLNLFSVCLLLASVLYIFCIVLASRKLRFMNKIYRELDTKKLLILSVLTACIVRLMTFIALITMDIENIEVAYNVNMNGPDKTNQIEHRYDRFYDGSMVVMFDLPNGIIVSTYVLLTIVWAECFLQSKLHTESNYKWKHRWLRAYMIFNSCLYSAQMTAYLVIFFGFITPTKIEKILRIGSSAMNLFAVVLVISLFFVMNVHFSGFPFRSEHAKSALRMISIIITFWSLARIIWAITLLAYFKSGISPLYSSESEKSTGSLVVFLLLLFCEFFPIIAVLDVSFLTMIGFQNVGQSPQDYFTDDDLSARLLSERSSHIHKSTVDETDVSTLGIETSETSWKNSTAAAQLYGEFVAPKKDNPLVIEK